MSNFMSLRLYFHHSERVLPTRKLHRIFRPSLASHLLHHAEKAGIEQAIVYHVQSGYLKGGRVAHHHIEAPHSKLPHCIELVDIEAKLRDFLLHHVAHLARVRAILVPCEIAREV